MPEAKPEATPEATKEAGDDAAKGPTGKILIVDDEAPQRLILKEAIIGMGYAIEEAESPQLALERLRYGSFDAMVTDLKMPGMDGIELLKKTLLADPGVSVIVVTAHGTIETAVDAMRNGAEDFLTKPIELDALELTLARVFRKRALLNDNKRLLSENEALREDLRVRYHLATAIGRSPEAVKLLDEIQKYMRSKAHTLVLGEPGSGEADVAKMLHYNSPWAAHPLIHFDCFTVPVDLHEKHLFGEEESRQPGATKKAIPGLIERAQPGSILITNIHKLNPSCQVRLSRVLREERTQRVGGTKFHPIYVKVISTSHPEDFALAMKSDYFRKDLYELMNENEILLPPIRNRRSDIPLLIAATAKRVGQSLGKEIEKIDKSAVDLLKDYGFPGDLRELESMVETAVIRCKSSRIVAEDFSFPGGTK